MGKEEKLIKMMSKSFEKSPNQLNKLFESDCEIINHNNNILLVNTDEFSQEDQFRTDDSFSLGWNICVGGISDILACGGIPLYYSHSLTIAEDWSDEYVENFTKGVSSALKKANAFFIGGDFGQTEKNWRCTVNIIGEKKNAPLKRSGASKNELIYISGKIGAGNIEAFLSNYEASKITQKVLHKFQTKFPLRLEESKIISKFATSCIDSSDGVFNGLNTISEQSEVGYKLENLPYSKTGLILTKLVSVPKSILFFGEAGEYELVFTIKKEDEEEFLKLSKEKNCTFYKIGKTTSKNIRTMKEKEKEIDLNTLKIRARDYKSISTYIKDLTKWIKSNG